MCWQTEKWLGEINDLVTSCEGGTDGRRQKAGEAERTERGRCFLVQERNLLVEGGITGG